MDTYVQCPRCLENMKQERDRLADIIAKQYGVIPQQEYLAAIRDLASLENWLASPIDFKDQNLRIITDGTLDRSETDFHVRVTCKAHCIKCGYTPANDGDAATFSIWQKPPQYWRVIGGASGEVTGVTTNKADVLAEEPGATFEPITKAFYDAFNESEDVDE